MAAHFFFRSAPQPGRALVVLLPGASGLKVFEDGDHYERAAREFNSWGFDAVLVDYKAAYRAASNPPDLETGGKIAWVLSQVTQWARETGKSTSNEPGAVVAWSLGAEGLWGVLSDRTKLDQLGLRAAAAYYPSNEEKTPIRSAVPLLVLTGEKDDVTELKDIRRAAEGSDAALVELVTYPGALHGFDIESLKKPRKVSLIPIVGPTATFGYGAAAATDSQARLRVFLEKHLR